MKHTQQLKCQSCGSTDVVIDPPYYRCSYCKSRHRLPKKVSGTNEVIVWRRRKWRLLVGLTVLVSILVGFVAYNTLLLRSSSHVPVQSVELPLEKPMVSHVSVQSAESLPQKPTISFKNRVFSIDTFSSIRDLVPTKRGTYLVGGLTPYNHIQVVELSSEGDIIFSKKLSNGFYTSLSEWEEKGILASYYQMGQKGETDYLDVHHNIVRKVPEGFAKIVRYKDGFIGVRDGRIVCYDGTGKQVWRKQVDTERMIARAGAHKDASGKMVPYSRQSDVLDLRKLVRLKSGNFVAIGKYKRSRLAVVIFSPEGVVIAYKKIDLGRIYPDALYATKDGGFVLMARRGIRWITFDQNGNLLSKRTLQKDYGKSLYGYAISEDESGYIVTYSEGDAMVIARVNNDGIVTTRHRYAKSGLRLHPQKIIPKVGGGFLIAVNTEIHESWLVKVDHNGQIDANLDDPTLDRNVTKNLPLPMSSTASQKPGDLFPAQEHIEENPPQPMAKKTIPSTSFLGDRIFDMVASADGKYLYAATGATGFKIFQIEADGTVRLLSNLLRTRSKLIVKRHRISIAGGKIPPHGSPEYYDEATHVVVNRDQTRAYISDIEHGFYVLDITDKTHPRLLVTLEKVKNRTFALSEDERTLYFYDGTIHAWRVDQLEQHKTTALDTASEANDMLLLYHGNYLVIPDKREILLYDTHQAKVVERYALEGYHWVSKIAADAQNHLYVAMDRRGIEQLRVSKEGKISPVNFLAVDTYFSDLIAMSESHTLCYAAKGGAMCLDTRHTLDPKPKMIYRNEAEDQATALVRLPKSHTLYIAFHTPSIGHAEVDP